MPCFNRFLFLLALAACGGPSRASKTTAVASARAAGADTVEAQGAPSDSYTPPNGFVPDSLTAVRIAVAVWTPIYGEKQIRYEAPYHAKLRDAIWTVEGSFSCKGACGGGVAEAQIAKGLNRSEGRTSYAVRQRANDMKNAHTEYVRCSVRQDSVIE